MDIKDFKFLKDEPIVPGSPGYFDFYHKYFSPALKDMVLSESCPHTIGLFSRWGTGKSSIIDQLSKDLGGAKEAHVFVFDAWKYQEDPLRRTFLIKLEEFLKNKGCNIPPDISSAYYIKHTNSYSSSRDADKPVETVKGFFRNIAKYVKDNFLPLFFALCILVVGCFYILSILFPGYRFFVDAKNFAVVLSAWTGFMFFLKPAAEEFLKKMAEKVFDSTGKFTEIRTKIEEEDRLNSPEQFEHIFNKLVECLKNGKLVVVFDNIDRVQGDVALKTLATIKTFLDPVERSKVIFLVPCDADAINKQIRAFYKNPEDPDFDESEYLKKLFNTVIYTPEFIDDDIHQYTSALIQNTGKVKDIILNEDVVSIITKTFKSNPREVKQFVNNLIGAVLVASKSEVADLILARENIGFFTKVLVLRQKFPDAYKKLKENWNDPQKILTDKPEQGLRDFLTLTSTITTDDAEPFIYFKAPQIAAELLDSKSVRKALVDGNTEDFEKLVSAEEKKEKLARFVSRLLKNYKSQDKILLRIFKTQLQGYANLAEKNTSSDFLEVCLETVEIIWNSYLELPPSSVFDLLVRSNNRSRRDAIIERYVLTLSNDEVKADENKVYLHDLVEELIKNKNHLTAVHQSKVMDAIRQNLAGRDDILLHFTSIEIQKTFVHPDSLRVIIQDELNNKNIRRYLPILNLYKDYIISFKFGSILLARVPEFLSLQNSETPSSTPEKLIFHTDLLLLFNSFGPSLKDLSPAQQQDILNYLNTAYNQVPEGDEIRSKIVNTYRWLSLRATDENTKTQADTQINNFISRTTGELMTKVLAYWNEKARLTFIKSYFASIKVRSVNEDSILKVVYESADDSQKLELIQHVIIGRSDHAIKFLSEFSDKLPDRQEIAKVLLAKSQGLAIQDRQPIFQYLKGKIMENDDVTLKQTAIKQVIEYLKSNDENLVNLGVTLLEEKFLSDSDQREIAKEMLDFYNTRSGPLHQYDLGVVSHFVRIESKLQDVLKEKVVYLIFSNISPDRQFTILPALIDQITLMKLDSDKYEKDYSDLTERLLTWPDSGEKDLIVKKITETLANTQGKKGKECLEKLKPLVKSE